MPCVSLLGTFGGAAAKQEFLWDSVRYGLEMGAAGALAGTVGGLAARGKLSGARRIEVSQPRRGDRS